MIKEVKKDLAGRIERQGDQQPDQQEPNFEKREFHFLKIKNPSV